MKHIATYQNWNRLTENEKASLEDLKYLVDLGLADNLEYLTRRREELGPLVFRDFIKGLNRLFAQHGVVPEDQTTPRQQKNGTWILQLSPAQAEKILFGVDSSLMSHLKPSLKDKWTRLLGSIEPARAKMQEGTRPVTTPGHWHGTVSLFQYFIRPSGFYYTFAHLEPTSGADVKFDGSATAEEALARFVYRLAMDAANRYGQR